MKKETFKELGKLHYDIAKIILALIIIGGIIKNDKIYSEISVPAIFITIFLIAIGTVLINKGAKDE